MDYMEMQDYLLRQPMVGKAAPDFTAQAYSKEWEDAKNPLGFREVKLEDYKGKWLVLFFYPLDFTFVCPTEIMAFDTARGEFQKRNAEVLGASIDSQFVHKAWVDSGQLGALKLPLLADLTKQVADDYGVLTEKGFALRGLFIIDPEGLVQYSVIHNTNIGRSVDETLRVIDALKTGGACPANWKSGDKTL